MATKPRLQHLQASVHHFKLQLGARTTVIVSSGSIQSFYLVIFDVLPLCRIDRLVRAPKRKVCCMLQKQCWVPLTRRHGANVCGPKKCHGPQEEDEAFGSDPAQGPQEAEAFASAKGVHRECRDDSGLHTPENSLSKTNSQNL